MLVSVLLIGGSGFVGRNLAVGLIGAGHQVWILDRMERSGIPADCQVMIGDAQDPEVIHVALERSRANVVYHLAANSDISAGIGDASLDFGDTLMTTIALAQVVPDSQVREIVFASSSAIFGVLDEPAPEAIDTFANPVSWYGKAKLASEYVLDALSSSIPRLRVLIVRFPNVVGPAATHGVVHDFIRKLQADSSHLEVLGDGHQTKPYVHVSELLDGIEFFRRQLPAGVTRINLGPPDTVSVRDIAATICSVLGVTPAIHYGESPYGWPGDVPRYSFDTAAMSNAGFQITTSSKAAVRRAAEDLVAEWS